MILDGYKTWIEIDNRAVQKNVRTFRSILKKNTKLFAVVKSNAYGHGLVVFGKLADQAGVDGFCVDSVVEGIKLRENGIKKPILVLGPTLPILYREALRWNLTVTVSNFEALREVLKLKSAPYFHLKIDTGMHRQGFYINELSVVLKLIGRPASAKGKLLTGAYTHFAAAKDVTYPSYTLGQIEVFQIAKKTIEDAGFSSLIFHTASTGGALLYPQAHFDLVRIGIGLYGHWPSFESSIQHSLIWKKNLQLEPVLSWYGRISEIKKLAAGDFIGYDLTEKIKKACFEAIVPVGYWHGFPRALSSIGEILIAGRREKILGRVSMDLLSVSLSSPKAKIYDRVVLIGRSDKQFLTAEELAVKTGTTVYEFLTRLNPLLIRIVV
ncbi:MAG: alanine racemase [bacterium]|nr:alanine racemase [bacterium]